MFLNTAFNVSSGATEQFQANASWSPDDQDDGGYGGDGGGEGDGDVDKKSRKKSNKDGQVDALGARRSGVLPGVYMNSLYDTQLSSTS